MDIYQFMIEIYVKDWRDGVPAPFFEYVLSSDWIDKSYIHRNQVWEDNEKIVAFCFIENLVNCIYFNLHPGYEGLAGDMVDYAENICHSLTVNWSSMQFCSSINPKRLRNESFQGIKRNRVFSVILIPDHPPNQLA